MRILTLLLLVLSMQIIAGVLPKGKIELLPDVSNREFWDAKQKDKGYAAIIAVADEALKNPAPQPNEELYSDFITNGSRVTYQTPYLNFMNQTNTIGTAGVITGDDKYIKVFEKNMRVICSLKSWILPAHDKNLDTFNGKQTFVDLTSSFIAFESSLLNKLLAPKLTPELHSLITESVEKKVLTPFEQGLRGTGATLWWLNSKSNWNIVCLSDLCGAVLSTDMSDERREFFIKNILKYSENFLEGFGTDGYCSEGMSYWNYGFGRYIKFAVMIYTITDGKKNLFDNPKAKLAADYPNKIMLSNNIFPAFSDCKVDEKLSTRSAMLKDRLNGVSTVYSRSTPIYNGDKTNDLMIVENSPKVPADAPRIEYDLAPYSEFADAGVFIFRNMGKGRLDFAFKGGSNYEFHNHNDVGSFVISVDGTLPILADPGSEVYSARSFSAKRYECKINSSFGHNVPSINGQLQIDGQGTKAEIISKSNDDNGGKVVIDYKNAYKQLKFIEKLERSFIYTRSGKVEIIDSADFSEAVEFDSALITFGKWKTVDANNIEISYKGKSINVNIDSNGAPFTVSSETIKENMNWKENPERISIKLSEKVTNVNIKLTITAK